MHEHTPIQEDVYDAIIVGARIAGAATAALLARQGARVLLLDRARFPATTVSCPIFFGNSLAVLDRIGALAAVEAIGAPKIRSYGTRTPDFDLVTRLPESNGYDYAYSIRRDVLDDAILQTVIQHPNITLREGFTVSGLVQSEGRVVGVRGRAGSSATETILADAVIGADGKRSVVARLVEASDYDRVSGQTAIYYAYYRDFAPLHEPSALIYADPRTQKGVLVFDADSGLTVVSAGVAAGDFETAKRDPEGTLEQLWRAVPELAERGKHATRATPVMGQAPMDSYYRQSFGPGWALVGDAGMYLDPITGQGINNALTAAELFAEAWGKTRRRASWMNAMAEYQRRRDAATRPIYNLVALGTQAQQMSWMGDLGVDLGTPIFKAIARQPATVQQYIGIFNGATPVSSFFNPLNLTRIMVRSVVAG
ncbi:MAG: FAD-dependent monooxygenase [Roseiflexaceae bacterium]|nr:FAD-dependent monooxygenase [Roseiflexaceae bacterium]